MLTEALASVVVCGVFGEGIHSPGYRASIPLAEHLSRRRIRVDIKEMEMLRRLLKGTKGGSATTRIPFDPTIPLEGHRPSDPTYTPKATLMVAKSSIYLSDISVSRWYCFRCGIMENSRKGIWYLATTNICTTIAVAHAYTRFPYEKRQNENVCFLPVAVSIGFALGVISIRAVINKEEKRTLIHHRNSARSWCHMRKKMYCFALSFAFTVFEAATRLGNFSHKKYGAMVPEFHNED